MMKKITVISALLLAASFQAAHADFVVKVGYADGLRGGGFFPDPWDGSPNTNFFGQPSGGRYDSGAVQILNNGPAPIKLTTATVDSFTNGASFSIWGASIGSGVTIPAGSSLILAANNGDNFDTSDQGPLSPVGFDSMGKPLGDATKPHVKVTLDGTLYDLVDSGQVLNTSGFDFAYNQSNESFAWRPIGTFGGQAGDTPEPGTLALFGAGGLSAAAFFRGRKRR